jgi:hypothetical protein
MSARGRQLAGRALAIGASLALVLALAVGYVQRAAVDSEQFANRATAALQDDSVRSLVAARITDDVVLANQADLIAARPIIESAASAIVGSRAFTGLFHRAVRDVHRTLFERDRDTITLAVADVGTILAAALEKVRPSVAEDVGAAGKVELVQRDIGSLNATLVRIADRIRVLALLLLVAWLALGAAALWISRDRRRTVIELGVGGAAAGVLLLVAYAVGRSLALGYLEAPDERAAAGAVWDAFLADLRTATWILTASGAVVAAVAASVVKPVELGEPLRRVGAWLGREPARPAGRVLRGAAMVALGIVFLVEHELVLRVLVSLVGVYLVYEGASAVMRVAYRPPAAATGRARAPADERGRRIGISVAAAAAIAAVIAVFVGGGGATTAAPPDGGCNGERALCDRALARVALPATHNSMSVPLRGWYSSSHDRPIADQLRDGIRGLLIDTHYADRLANGRVRTYFGGREELRRRAHEDGVNPDAVDAAMRVRDRLGFKGEGERGMYLCHSFCELGATPLESVLDDLRDFLVANPGAVVVVVNQDYVTPEDFVAAVDDAGLGDLVYGGPIDAERPTLGDMVERDERLVLLAENRAGAAPWYRLAYERITEETPYAFSKVRQLTDASKLTASCEPNRGPDDGPLFLLNHWITTDPVPLPSHAAKVNAYDPLLARVRECRDVRKLTPGLVAVNFYRRGDLFRVVDTLNGVR